ncbi:MAG TPA: hypothetical protein DIT55_06030 [Spirochaetaceae bacterium]|nr:hypothetical protein [Spirochaetaceae bacterium]
MSEPILRLHLSSTLHEDGIRAFQPESILLADGDGGPRLRRPLPSGDESPGTVAPGDYVFRQWRTSSFPSIEEGFEDFIRQVWWEGEKTEGPWILRVVVEDDDRAYQGLRLISKS